MSEIEELRQRLEVLEDELMLSKVHAHVVSETGEPYIVFLKRSPVSGGIVQAMEYNPLEDFPSLSTEDLAMVQGIDKILSKKLEESKNKGITKYPGMAN